MSIRDPLLQFDIKWPGWVYGKHEVRFLVYEDALADTSPVHWKIHPLFEARPKVLELFRSDKRSAVVLSSDRESVGEAWLRLAFLQRGGNRLLSHYCETYVYRKGWRDELTAQMDEQPSGDSIIPDRVSNLRCIFKRNEKRILFFEGVFSAELKKVD